MKCLAELATTTRHWTPSGRVAHDLTFPRAETSTCSRLRRQQLGRPHTHSVGLVVGRRSTVEMNCWSTDRQLLIRSIRDRLFNINSSGNRSKFVTKCLMGDVIFKWRYTSLPFNPCNVVGVIQATLPAVGYVVRFLRKVGGIHPPHNNLLARSHRAAEFSLAYL